MYSFDVLGRGCGKRGRDAVLDMSMCSEREGRGGYVDVHGCERKGMEGFIRR